MRSTSAILLLGVALLAPFSAALAADPVKVGVVLPLTGNFAEAGANVRRGYEMAVEEINAAGGIKALGGARLELVFGDHQGRQELAIGEVERLAQREKVAVFAGTWHSGATVAATQAAERQRVPFVVEIASADAITDRGLKYTVRINLKGSWNGTAAVNFIEYLNQAQSAGIKKVAILAEDSDFGQATARGVKAAVAGKGIEVISEQAYPSSSQDVTAQISRVKSANADMMITISQINDAVLVAKTAERIGLKIPKLGVSGGYTAPTFAGNAGAAADGWLVIDYFNKDMSAKANQLNDKFRQKYGADMKGFSALGYQAGIVIGEAVEKARSREPDAINRALHELVIEPGPKLIMPYDKIEFGPDGQNKFAAGSVQQMVSGAYHTVWPEKFGSRKIDLPLARKH